MLMECDTDNSRKTTSESEPPVLIDQNSTALQLKQSLETIEELKNRIAEHEKTIELNRVRYFIWISLRNYRFWIISSNLSKNKTLV